MQFKIAIDCIIIAYDHRVNQLKLLLIKRSKEPQKGKWALPGGFVKKAEAFVDTAKRKLRQETGMEAIYLEQLQAYSLTDESAHNRIASVAYYALINFDDYRPPATHTHVTQWFALQQVPALPFDHGQKVADAMIRIKESLKTRPLQFHLLPAKFPLNQLQAFYEEVYQCKLDNRNFRKWVKRLPYLDALDEVEANVSHRPGKLYQFDQVRYTELAHSTQLMVL